MIYFGLRNVNQNLLSLCFSLGIWDAYGINFTVSILDVGGVAIK